MLNSPGMSPFGAAREIAVAQAARVAHENVERLADAAHRVHHDEDRRARRARPISPMQPRRAARRLVARDDLAPSRPCCALSAPSRSMLLSRSSIDARALSSAVCARCVHATEIGETMRERVRHFHRRQLVVDRRDDRDFGRRLVRDARSSGAARRARPIRTCGTRSARSCRASRDSASPPRWSSRCPPRAGSASCASVCTSASDCVIVSRHAGERARATTPATTSSATRMPKPSHRRPRIVFSLNAASASHWFVSTGSAP